MFKEQMEKLIKDLKKERKKMGITSSVLAGLCIGTFAFAMVSSALSIPILTGILAMVSGTALGFSVNALVQTLILNSKVKMATKEKLEYEQQEELYYSNFHDKNKELENNTEIIKSNETQKIDESNEIINDANASFDTTQSNENISDSQTEIKDEDYKTLQNPSKYKQKNDGREC